MKFAINDHVRVIARTCRWFDQVGIVTGVNVPGTWLPFQVAMLEDHPLYFDAHELVLAERAQVMP